MKINFYPDSDGAILEEGTQDYYKIWREDGKKITNEIEKISGLKFKEKIINAIIYDNISYSYPLSLEASIPYNHKKATLVHELCHRLLIKNNIRWEKLKKKNDFYLNSHRPVDLILFDILTNLYGKKFAKENVEYEISLWSEKEISPYKIAWDWALGMTKEQRQKEFKKYLK